jgi:hypothetical protein
MRVTVRLFARLRTSSARPALRNSADLEPGAEAGTGLRRPVLETPARYRAQDVSRMGHCDVLFRMGPEHPPREDVSGMGRCDVLFLIRPSATARRASASGGGAPRELSNV